MQVYQGTGCTPFSVLCFGLSSCSRLRLQNPALGPLMTNVSAQRESPLSESGRWIAAVRSDDAARINDRLPERHISSYQERAKKIRGVPFRVADAAFAAPHPFLGKTRSESTREHVERHLAPPVTLLDPYARAAQNAARERAAQGAVPHVVGYTREQSREDERPCEAHAVPDGRDERREECGALDCGEQRLGQTR